MEAAAKKVQLLAQRILPDRPHHLSVSPDQRFRVPPDHSKLFEEFKYPRLQYMTLLSDADRGMLLTRPYYDMREEPPNLTAAKDPNAKMEKKSVTKLSLSDYKNKQKKVSDSLPDSGTTPKPDTSRRKEEVADGRMDRESKKTDAYRIREAEASKDVKAHRHHEVAHDESEQA
ncbi:hypothetical protein CH063_04607 [Colletotrichum higginsianum]|uniref:Uncharacterized protein n=1 Tax=Colletotrichum higginsianum (strain IMI 349063) TaxID=759273 RepID=H1UW17_COLHI|nr:hypothetical protein CH063_04607 [Colletotrichum higginsianum]